MRFDAKKGYRLHRYGHGVYTTERGWWYQESTRRWVKNPDFSEGGLTNCARCRTLRAFRRMLRKNPQIQGIAVWSNRYVGYDVYA